MEVKQASVVSRIEGEAILSSLENSLANVKVV